MLPDDFEYSEQLAINDFDLKRTQMLRRADKSALSADDIQWLINKMMEYQSRIQQQDMDIQKLCFLLNKSKLEK